jgi:hypothetical protein
MSVRVVAVYSVGSQELFKPTCPSGKIMAAEITRNKLSCQVIAVVSDDYRAAKAGASEDVRGRGGRMIDLLRSRTCQAPRWAPR